MTTPLTFAVPADGPDAALVYLVRRERLRYSRAFINDAILSHPKPSSLLALVEVSRRVGLEPTAARAEAGALEEVNLPAIVHFGGSGEGGFGVLEEISVDGYRLWDSVNGSRLVNREALLEQWSGVLVLMRRSAGRSERERGYFRARSIEIVAGRIERPALVGARANRPLQVVGALSLGVLLVLAVLGRSSQHRGYFITSVGLAVGGLALAWLALRVTADRGATLRICKRGSFFDCEGVLTSRYSTIFGLPLAEVGASFFGALLLLLAVAAPASGGGPLAAIAIAFIATIPFSLALIGVQVSMRQLCVLCLGVHTVNLLGAVLGVLMLRSLAAPVISTIGGLLFMGSMFLLFLFVVLPYVTSVDWIERRSNALRRMESSPFATLAQILTAPPLPLRARDCSVLLTEVDESRAHELVLFVHPGCSRCWTVLQELDALVSTGHAALYLAVAPKTDDTDDQWLCTVVMAFALSGGGSVALRAYRAAKEYLAGAGDVDPLDSIVTALGVSAPRAEDIEKARSLTRSAAAFAQTHTEGTPAVFLDGRPVSAPPRHLAYLLSHHAPLLEPLLETGRVEVVK